MSHQSKNNSGCTFTNIITVLGIAAGILTVPFITSILTSAAGSSQTSTEIFGVIGGIVLIIVLIQFVTKTPGFALLGMLIGGWIGPYGLAVVGFFVLIAMAAPWTRYGTFIIAIGGPIALMWQARIRPTCLEAFSVMVIGSIFSGIVGSIIFGSLGGIGWIFGVPNPGLDELFLDQSGGNIGRDIIGDSFRWSPTGICATAIGAIAGLVIGHMFVRTDSRPAANLSKVSQPTTQGLEKAESLNNQALQLKAQGNYVAAEPLFRRALVIYEHALGADHPAAQIVRGNLAELVEMMRDDKERKMKNANEITVKAYKEALSDLWGDDKILDNQMTWLKAHYRAPGRVITATELAELVGYKDHRG